MNPLKKQTKFVRLTLHTNSQHRITGRFHVPTETSASMRPSDIISTMDKKLIRLSDATVSVEGAEDSVLRDCVDVVLDAVAWIEYPEGSWHFGDS